MKKLTAGIFAGILTVVSVNVARADIATTNYVNQNVDNKVGDLDALTTTAKGNAVVAINELDGAIDTLNGDALVEGSIDNKITTSLMDTKSEINTLKGNVETLQGNAEKVGSVAHSIATAVGGLTGTTTGDGVVKTVTQTNGKVTVERGAVAESELDTALATKINSKMATTDYNTATTMAADGTYAKTTNTVGANLTALDTAVKNAADAAASAGTSATDALAEAKEYANGLNTAMDTRMDAVETKATNNASAITTLNGADTVTGSVDYKIKQVVTNINETTGGLDTRLDAVETKATNNASAITKLNGADTVEGSVDYKIKQAVDTINTTTTGLGTRLTTAETNITNLTNNKANSEDVYTKTEIDGKVTAINTDIGKKVTATNLNNKLLTTTTAGQLQDAASGLTKPDGCGKNGITCMLINDGAGFKWEKVVDTYTASTGA